VRFSVEDAIAAGLWVALGILALLSASDYRSTRAFLDTSERVNHAHEVVEQLDHLLGEMTDAETGQRGYLITGSVRYLAPHEQATARIADTLHAIRVLTADDAAQQERLNRLVPEVASRLRIMRETMDVYDQQGFAAARQHVLTDQGKNVMDGIRELVDEMQRAERTVLLDRSSAAHTSARLTLLVLLVGDLLALALVGSSYVIAMRGLAERHRHVVAVEKARGQAERATVADGPCHIACGHRRRPFPQRRFRGDAAGAIPIHVRRSFEEHELKRGMPLQRAEDRTEPGSGVRRGLLFHVRVDQSQHHTHALALHQIEERDEIRKLLSRGVRPADAEGRRDVASRWREAVVHPDRIRASQFEANRIHSETVDDIELCSHFGSDRSPDDRVDGVELMDHLPGPVFGGPSATLELHVQASDRQAGWRDREQCCR